MLSTLLWHDEVRPSDQVPAPTKKDKPTKKQLDQAVELIETLSCPWDPSRYEDEYEKRLKAIIRKKQKGQTVESPEPEEDEPSPVADLLAALERSLEKAKSGNGRR